MYNQMKALLIPASKQPPWWISFLQTMNPRKHVTVWLISPTANFEPHELFSSKCHTQWVVISFSWTVVKALHTEASKKENWKNDNLEVGKKQELLQSHSRRYAGIFLLACLYLTFCKLQSFQLLAFAVFLLKFSWFIFIVFYQDEKPKMNREGGKTGNSTVSLIFF